MALILTINRSSLPEPWCRHHTILPFDDETMMILDGINYEWKERSAAEENKEWKQLIPYILVVWNGKIANYCRSGNEKRLTGLRSLGVGGHIELCDQENAHKLSQIVLNGAGRELKEEFGINGATASKFNLLGIINEEDSEVGKVHLGIVLVYNSVEQPVPEEELTDLIWTAPTQVDENSFEFWSVMALELYRSWSDSYSASN